MAKDLIQKRIEANEKRARPIHDVGLEEDVLHRRDRDGGNFLTSLARDFFYPEKIHRHRDRDAFGRIRRK